MAELGVAEQALQNVNTRRQEIKSVNDVMTRRKPVEGDTKGVYKSPTERGQRGALAALKWDLKNLGAHDTLQKIHAESTGITSRLDTLSRQFHENGKFLDVGKGSKERDSIYAVTIDVNPPKEGESDTRTPWVFIGGAESIPEQNIILSTTLALQGEKVTILSYPEQMREQTGGRNIFDKVRNTGKQDVTIFKKAITALGVSKVSLMGDSLGSEFIIEIASDSEFAKQVAIEDVLALQPVGFERRKVLEMGTAEGAAAKRNENDPEARVVMVEQGNQDARRGSGLHLEDMNPLKLAVVGGTAFLSVGRAAASHTITPEVIESVTKNISGNLEIWTGGKDTLSRADAVNSVLENAVEGLPQDKKGKIASYVVPDADHNDFIVHAIGLLRVREEEQEARKALPNESYIGKKIRVDSDSREMGIEDMERTWAERLLKQLKPA